MHWVVECTINVFYLWLIFSTDWHLHIYILYVYFQSMSKGAVSKYGMCANPVILLKWFERCQHWPKCKLVYTLWTGSSCWIMAYMYGLVWCDLFVFFRYTSIGNRNNTVPNPALAIQTKDGQPKYRPAYTLIDPHAERTGRQ